MSSAVIMDAILAKIKTVLSESDDLLSQEVTPETAEEFNKLCADALSAGWIEGLRAWLTTAESDAETIEIDGTVYRYKLDSEKEFLAPGGKLTLNRRVYQPDKGGECHVPIDAAWGMEDQFATVEVRDAVLYAVALGTATEAETLLTKCSLFRPSSTAIKHMTKRMGRWLEEHENEVLENIRDEESLPEETRILCASLDGVNVLLSEPGRKKGRPNERPREGESREAPSPTRYKNAMVGSVSLYGEVSEGKASPTRLISRYAARMPEDRAPTLKAKFERELRKAESRLGADVAKIVLCDGARGLWSYVDENPLYDDYEKLIDFHHATEHLSVAAEAIFGKGSAKGQAWYDKHRAKLKEADDGARALLRSMDYYARTGGLSNSRRESLSRERTFFRRNAHRMDYARFRRNGWPIGSGPIEAACKSVVKTRLCRSGMRWSRSGGQHVLSLRTYVKSERWDALWKQYKRIERFSRSHVT